MGGTGELVMVHTVAGLIDLFDELRAEIDPEVPVRHVVQAALLTDAIDAGGTVRRDQGAHLRGADGGCRGRRARALHLLHRRSRRRRRGGAR